MAFALRSPRYLCAKDPICIYMKILIITLTLTALVFTNDLVIASENDDAPISTGTGIAVSRQGHVLTNYHVVENCAAISLISEGKQKELAIIATDSKNDLAILKLSQTLSYIAHFRDGRGVRAGDSIVVVGFPFHNLLASEANVTTGTVSALAGLQNDSRLLQITAPVQPGNSGGPLLDKSGHVVGIVDSKLNAFAVALLTGDIPQNINFAIKDLVARAFMDSHNIPYERSVSAKDLDAADIGDIAKQFTFLLKCYPQEPKLIPRHSLEAERRALEKERQALAAERRRSKDQHAVPSKVERQRGHARETEPSRERTESQTTRGRQKTEVVEKQATFETEVANQDAFRDQQEKRAREAINEARRQALNAEPAALEEARRKAEEARAQVLQMEVAKLPNSTQASAGAAGGWPSSAFNHAYNDYLNGKYESAITGFQLFINDFTGASLIPDAYYWMGASYYSLKEYAWAIQTFDYLVAGYPGNAKVPSALYKLSLALAETHNLARSRDSLRQLINDFPYSDEAQLAKMKLREVP